jgi:hypothetical protein
MNTLFYNIDTDQTIEYKQLLKLSLSENNRISIPSIDSDCPIFLQISYSLISDFAADSLTEFDTTSEAEVIDSLFESEKDPNNLFMYIPQRIDSTERVKAYRLRNYTTSPFKKIITLKLKLHDINKITNRKHNSFETALHHLVGLLNQDSRLLHSLSSRIEKNKLIRLLSITVFITPSSTYTYAIPPGLAKQLLFAFESSNRRLTLRELEFKLPQKEIIINGNHLLPLIDHISFKNMLNESLLGSADLPYNYSNLLNFEKDLNAYCLYYHKESESIIPLCHPINAFFE